MKTILGLDLGVASVGWALFEKDENGLPCRLVDLGSFVYDQIENKKTGLTENIDRRQKRSMRRQRRRRVRRLADGRSLFKKSLGVDFASLDLSKFDSPFALKLRGLEEKLSKEELSIALYHYLKYRGFKSNRKSVADANEDKKMLAKYAEVEKDLKSGSKPMTITEYLIKKAAEKGGQSSGARIHNTSDEFNLTVTREMYQEEIEQILDRQIAFRVIDGSFKQQFMALFLRQRDFSDGPSEPSKYHVDFKDLIGKCKFDGIICAPKDSPTAKRFVLLSSLANFRFKEKPEDEYASLTPEQICELEKKAMAKSEMKYKDVFNALGFVPFRVKGLELSKKERDQIYAASAEETGSIDFEKASEAIKEKQAGKAFFRNSAIVVAANKSAKGGKPIDEALLDHAAEILVRCKTDARIEQVGKEEGLTQKEIDWVKELPDCKAVINLSLPLCRSLLPLLRKGRRYDDAMAELGHSHSAKKHLNGEKRLPNIEEALKGAGITLRNPVVKHTLVQVIKIVNAIIDKYGAPEDYCVELARELKKNFKERGEILSTQLENQAKNIALRGEMLNKYPNIFKSFDQTKGEALLKYKLFKEQRGHSPYTGKPINEQRMFDNNFYQIDHIQPYSRSFNDSFSNKVLVEAKENQEKGSKTPFEHYQDTSTIAAFLKTCYLGREKSERLLAKTFDESNFVNKDLGDTAYLSRLTRELLDFYLMDEGRSVRTVPGSVTEKLRVLWRVSGRTHSFIEGSSYETLYHAKTIDNYVLTDVSVDKDTLLFTFVVRPSCREFAVEIKKIAPKKGQELGEKGTRFNRAIDYCAANLEGVRSKYLGHGDVNISAMLDLATRSPDGSIGAVELMGILAQNCYRAILADSNKKIRSNDLHHALDACVIACATPGVIHKVVRFFEFEENKERYAESGGDTNLLPLPYPDFDREVLARVYERDEKRLFEILSSLPMYKNNPPKKPSVHVLVPTRLPNKNIAGALSKETVFGEREGALWIKKSVLDLKESDLKDVYNPNGGNQAVINAIKDWMHGGKTGYPILPKKGTPIKKVRLKVAENTAGKVDLSNGKFAENGSCVRVAIYKKKAGSEYLFFVPIYYYQILQRAAYRNGHGPEPEYTIMWKRGDDGIGRISQGELEEGYVLIGECNRYTLLEIAKEDGKGLVYSGGATGGKLEVYSLLGDYTDLVATRLTTGESADALRLQLTTSTFKDIKVRNISVLGHIS